jgi:septal ring factor EnvC (AmiA/AmiB activator)
MDFMDTIPLGIKLFERKKMLKPETIKKVISRLPFLFLCILLVIMFNKRDEKIENLQTQIIETNIKLEEANKDIEKLQAYCKELEASTDINRKEFIYIWESLGTVRNNFVALGKGLHLDEEDICPPSECGRGRR